MYDPVRLPEIGDDALRFYKEEGYLVLPGLISPEEAENLKADVLGIMSVIGLGKTKLKQTSEYLAGTTIDGLVNSPNLCQVASRLMEGPATLYLPFTAVKSGVEPGEEVGGGQFHFHQDNQYTRFDGPGINLWVALMPMTEENGCLRILPRVSLDRTLPTGGAPDNDGHRTVPFEVADAVPIVMQPGDCVAFSRLTVHGSGPNLSPDHRVAYAVQYHRDDVSASTDGGQTYLPLKTNPRYKTVPVEHITPPKSKIEGH
jgi:hypothetical protein